MENEVKKVTYTTTNSYTTLNKIGPKTKNVWLVFHGIGFLSKYFLKYFDELNPDENYIIAPQAPSKYYLKNEYKHVGASWLTKVDTEQEMENLVAYLDSMLQAEKIPENTNFIILGFSQGVSIATRYLAKTKLKCHKLIIYAGGIPNELIPSDVSYLIDDKAEVVCIVGDEDEYLTPERMRLENKKITNLFQDKAKKIIFQGGHEMKKEIINNLV
ncbi:MAG: esterase [Maribacter sp.]